MNQHEYESRMRSYMDQIECLGEMIQPLERRLGQMAEGDRRKAPIRNVILQAETDRATLWDAIGRLKMERCTCE